MIKKLKYKQVHLIVVLIAIAAILVGSIILFGGKSWKKLSVRDLTDVSFDIYRMQGLMYGGGLNEISDSIFAGAYADIFRKHSTTQQDYDSTFAWYVKNKPEKLLLILQSVQDSLSHSADRQDSLYRLYQSMANLKEPISGEANQNGINFFSPDSIQFVALGRDLFDRSFDAPTIKGKTEKARFEMALRIHGLRDIKGESPITMSLKISRGDTELTSKMQELHTNGLHRISIPIPMDEGAYRIKALVRSLNGKSSTAFSCVSIDSLSLIRYD